MSHAAPWRTHPWHRRRRRSASRRTTASPARRGGDLDMGGGCRVGEGGEAQEDGRGCRGDSDGGVGDGGTGGRHRAHSGDEPRGVADARAWPGRRLAARQRRAARVSAWREERDERLVKAAVGIGEDEEVVL